jgi:hypothetical protein
MNLLLFIRNIFTRLFLRRPNSTFTKIILYINYNEEIVDLVSVK